MARSGSLPILDLYVGSLSEPLRVSDQSAVSDWLSLTSDGAESLLGESTREAFQASDDVDRQAYERIILGFLGHRESMPEHSWVAMVGGGPAGACLVSSRFYYSAEREYPYIDLVAVDPHFQGRGLGAALLRQTLTSLTTAGHRSIVHAHIRRGNVASERLFAACGFICWRRDD